jgi:spore coat protein CotH
MQTSSQHKLIIEQYSKQGELQQTYSPLQNMLCEEKIDKFSTSEISYNLKNFVDVETQLSYDDSINLILNNDEESPRIINTQFRKLGNNRYEYLTRNQSVSTNLYDESNLVSTTDLFLRSDV